MTIQITQGSVNTTNLVVPGLDIGIIPPQPNTLNGVPSNIVGYVGVASYGPINVPMTVSSYAQFVSIFGPSTTHTSDLGAAVQIATQNGANVITCVRVTDHNHSGSTSLAAASVALGVISTTNAATITAIYGGSAGNSFSITINPSLYPNAQQVVLTSGLAQPEIFDNITNTTPTAFWTALVNAINNGNSATRPASKYFVATLGTNTTAAVPVSPNPTTFTLAGGVDGVTGIVAADFVGNDGTSGSRKGMYSLRGTGCATATLCDLPDTNATTWAGQLAFGLSERIYMITQSPAGDTITAMTTRGTNGASGYGLKLMFGDWLYWFDSVNGIPNRIISPATFMAARLANQSPALTSVNQPVYGVVGSQFANAGMNYTYADVLAITQAGYDVITPPGQGATSLPIWSGTTGRNTNYNTAAYLDNYTTMTNYIVNTMAAVGGMGQFVGQLITPQLLAQEKAVLDTYFQNLQDNSLIGNSGGGQAYQNLVTSTPQQQQNGIVIISSTVSFLAVNLFLVVQLQAGQTVSFTSQSTGFGQ